MTSSLKLKLQPLVTGGRDPYPNLPFYSLQPAGRRITSQDLDHASPISMLNQANRHL